MGTFLLYIIKASFFLIIFFLIFKIFLGKETFYKINRIVVLSSVVLSLVLPTIALSLKQPVYSKIPVGIRNFDQLFGVPESYIRAEPVDNGRNILLLFALLYLAGALVQFFIAVFNFRKIASITKSGTIYHYNNCLITVVKKNISPFSWGKHIVISQTDYEQQPEIIIQHELIHIKKSHTIDLLFMEFISVLFWFNPAVWLLKKELKNIHEFEVDNALIQQGVDAKEYQLALIRKAVGQRLFSVSNSFNQSNLSKRIHMMLRKKSSPWASFKYLLIFVLTGMSILVFAKPELSDSIRKVKAENLIHYIKDNASAISDKLLKLSKTDSKKAAQIVIPSRFQQMAIRSIDTDRTQKQPVCFINGKQVSYEEFEKLNPNAIKKVSLLKDDEAVKQYGSKAKHGAILIDLTEGMPEYVLNTSSVRIDSVKNVAFTYAMMHSPLYIIFIDGKPNRPLILPNDAGGDEFIKQAAAHGKLESTITIMGKAATERYGEKGKNGVVEVYLKNTPSEILIDSVSQQ